MGLRRRLQSGFGRLCAAWNALLSPPRKCQPRSTATNETEDQILQVLARLGAELSAVECRLFERFNCRLQDELLAKQQEHWRAAGDLRGFDWKGYSQNGEDGIIREIFHRIGTTNKFFVEFGVETGAECNTRLLAQHEQWSGLYFEPVEASFGQLINRWQEYPQVRAVQTAVTSRNFKQLLAEHGVPREFDLLSIDIDGNDYWVWNSLTDWRLRVVVIEYNSFHLPPKKWVMHENDDYRWNGTTYFGAAFTSLRNLGRTKGYTIVGTDPRGVNMFFVRTDCLPNDKFLDPELQYFFQPFGYRVPPVGEGSFVEC